MENKLRQFNLDFLVAGAVSAIIVWFEVAFPLGLMLLPLPTIYIAVKRGNISFVTFLFAPVTAYFLYGITAAMFITLNFLPVAIVISICLKKRVRMFDSVLFAMAALGLSILLFTLYVNFKFKSDLLTYFVNLIQKRLVNIKGLANIYLTAFNSQEIIAGTKTQEYFMQLEQSTAIQMAMVYVKDILTVYMPPILGMYVLSSGLLSYTVSHHFLKKSGVDLVTIPSFENYTLPKNFIWAIVFVIAYMLVGSYINSTNYQAISTTLMTGVFFVLTIEGISFASWFLKRRNTGTFFRRFILVFAWLILYNIFMYIGIFEYIFKVRKTFNNVGNANKL